MIYLGNAYASQDAAYDYQCQEDYLMECLEFSMVEAWEEGKTILGHSASAAIAVWGNLESAAMNLVGRYHKQLKRDAEEARLP